MMKKIIFAFVCMFGLSVWAEEEKETEKEEEITFERVINTYNAATPLKFSEIGSGVKMGDCESWKNKDYRRYYTLLAAMTKPKENLGPGFAVRNENKIGLFEKYYFSTTAEGVRKSMLNQWEDFKESGRSDDVAAWEQGGMRGEVRKYDNIILTNMEITFDLKCYEESPICDKEGEVIKAGTVIYACYFFDDLE